MTTLPNLLGDFSLAHDVTAGYVSQLTNAVALFGKFLGRVPDTDDFNADAINRFLDWLKAQGRKPETVRGRRRMLVTLWRFAESLELCPPPPSQLRTVKVPARVPTAFTVEQMCALLAAADSTERPLWWRSLLLASYDTALRLGDLLSIERPDVWPDGSLSIVQSKTGRTHRVKLRAETLKAIDKHLAGRTTGLIWPLWARREALYRAFQKLRQAAGIKSGTLRWIRRSSASYVEAAHPGMGWRHLGHSAPGLAEKAYIDPRIVRPTPTLPPRLTG